jgi:hypothetical protein
MFTGRKMQRDVSAVADVCPRQGGGGCHNSQYFLCDSARYGCHWGYEHAFAIWRYRCHHSPRNDARRQRIPQSGTFSQKFEFATKFVEHVGEAFRADTVGSIYLAGLAEGLDDQVDGTVMKMKPAAVFQQPYLGSWLHSDFPRANGQGLPGLADILRCPLLSMIESSGRTWSM